MRRVLLVVLSLTLASLASSANILDLIYRNNETNLGKEQKEAELEEQASTDDTEKSCDCTGAECMCCVDFNMTFIDLGKGCVRMRYISQSEGVLLNVSYGDNLLRSGVSRGPRPAATCVSMIGQLAAVCARFTSLLPLSLPQPHDDGLKGCLQLEPKLLGDVQTRFAIGCFAMDHTGMRLDDSVQQEPATLVSNHTSANEATETGSSGNLNEDEILAAVNESAQKGLAFFQNWLGLDFSAHAAAAADNATLAEEDGNTAAAAADADAKQAVEATDVTIQKANQSSST